jgi:hypothetical protein
MEARQSEHPTARSSDLPPPVRRSVIPRPADDIERAPVTPPRPAPTSSARLGLAAIGTLLVGVVAGLALLAPRPTARSPVAQVAPALPPARGALAGVPSAPVTLAEAARVAEAPVAEAPVARRHHHRGRRPMFASADRYTLIILP